MANIKGLRYRPAGSVMTLLLACTLIAPFVGTAQTNRPRLAPEQNDTDNTAAGPGREISVGGTKVILPDLVLRDHEGRRVRFYSDLIKDKVVVLSFFYTSCTYSCTLQGRTFSKLQSLLGERLGKSVFLISITIDPAKDDPARLKTWGKRYEIQPGWTLVTGEVAEMNKLLKPFTGSVAGEGMHLPSTFIGNDKKGLWTSGLGVFSPESLLKTVDFMMR